ncbi:MAG: adenylate/guanylate cyclase domain-containing protein, partial [Candidatus Thorarchaeota archaeon]
MTDKFFLNYLDDREKIIRKKLADYENSNYIVGMKPLEDLKESECLEGNYTIVNIQFSSFFIEHSSDENNKKIFNLFTILLNEIISLLEINSGLLADYSFKHVVCVFGIDYKEKMNPIVNGIKFALNLMLLLDERFIPSLNEKKIVDFTSIQVKIGIAHGQTYIEKLKNMLAQSIIIYGNAYLLASKLSNNAKWREVALAGNVVNSISEGKTSYIAILSPEEKDWPENSALIKFYNPSIGQKVADF